MRYGCIGEKLGHSFSVEIHRMIGRYEYELMPVAREALDAFMTRREFDGINVTIPYKKAVIPYCEALSEEARLCGAVNTVVRRGAALYGYNTDFLGMRALLDVHQIDPKGKRVLILGSGGTSNTAEKLMQSLGAASCFRVSRTPDEGMIGYEEAARRTDTEILINTTPVGMFPQGGVMPIDPTLFPQLEAVVDAVYNPARTELVLRAGECGVKAVGGLYMLVAQAVLAAQIFTGEEIPEDEIGRIERALAREKENLILTGMPSSGKSTIGRALAERLGRPFFDSDEEIVREEKRSIPEIFSLFGEAYFRAAETRVLKRLCAERGAVIATGGGAPLREENCRAFRSNGEILFLDAPLQDLTGGASRPLTPDPEAMAKRYRERIGIYRATADRIIPVSRDLEENLERIIKECL